MAKDHLNLLHPSATDSILKVKSEMDKLVERWADTQNENKIYLTLFTIDTISADM